jgi:hypothetical protein
MRSFQPISMSYHPWCDELRQLTSHPSTSFMISFSRAIAAWLRRYASRSCSARIRGTRWILDQACSLFSSLSVSIALAVDHYRVRPAHVPQGGQAVLTQQPAGHNHFRTQTNSPLLKITSSHPPETQCTDPKYSSKDGYSTRSSRW